MLKLEYLSHALSDFDEIWCVELEALRVPGDGLVVKTGNRSRNEPSAATFSIWCTVHGTPRPKIEISAPNSSPDYPILLKNFICNRWTLSLCISAIMQ